MSPNNALLGTRLLYVLPLRALAGGVCRELVTLRPDLEESVRVHHGDRPESHIFAEPACITTMDQYLCAFAGAPLSFGANHGHAVAGAALASYSVFDEVHLLSPERGLPLLVAMLQQRRRWGFPSVAMTATLPRKVRSYMEGQAGLEVITVGEAEAHELRDSWRQVTLELVPEPLDAAALAAAVAADARRGAVIVFANTVRRALQYYQAVKAALQDDPALSEWVTLAHSRFTPAHRRALDQRITQQFGPEADGRGVLVTTQVAEAGLNISAPVVYSDLAPVDSLLQRAGRCARFRPSAGKAVGILRVITPKTDKDEPVHPPYPKDLVTITGEQLRRVDGQVLTWPVEQQLVDDVLEKPYLCYIRGDTFASDRPEPNIRGLTPAKALGLYEQAYRTRDPGSVERALRDVLPANLVIRPRHELQGKGAEPPPLVMAVQANMDLSRAERRQLETVSVSQGTLFTIMRERPGELLRLFVNHEDRTVKLERTRYPAPGETYVLAAEVAGYTEALGLSLHPVDAPGSTGWVEPDRPPVSSGGQEQEFCQHARGVFQRVQRLIHHYRPFLVSWQRVFPETVQAPEEFVDALLELIGLAALYHDVGKLSRGWQEDVGWHGPGYIARTAPPHGQPRRRRPRPHAYHAFPFLRLLLEPYASGAPVHEWIALAAARHHTITRDGDTLRWRGEQYDDDVMDLLRSVAPDPDVAERIGADLLAPLAQDGLYTLDAPSPADDFYPLYCIANRLIKLADQEDAAGHEIELVANRAATGGATR